MNKTQNGFVILMAFLMSLIALAIDAMLPALGQIGSSLNLSTSNDAQYVISTVFLGMSFGLMLYGPLSDARGRKPALYIGIIIFIIGSIFSLFATSFTVMLIGRFLQGFGAAATRVVSMAMIRDKFEGDEMGRIMSLIMVVFILVPALAPSLGQVILYLSDWRSIFATFVILGLLALILLRYKQEETLSLDKRIPFSFKSLKSGAKETLLHATSKYYTLASGLIFGAFIGYLSTVQQLFQVKFDVGESFSFYFGGLALCIGFSSYINSKLIIRFGMLKLSLFSVFSLSVISALYYFAIILFESASTLVPFMFFLGLSFLIIGILFGTLNTLALNPLGHIAGIANSVITSTQTFISGAIGAYIGQCYDGTVKPIVISFFVLGLLSLCCLLIANKKS